VKPFLLLSGCEFLPFFLFVFGHRPQQIIITMATTSCSQSLVFASSHVSSSSSSSAAAAASTSSSSLSARNALVNCSTTSATASSVRRASSTRGRGGGGGGFQKGSHLGTTTFVVRECRRVAPFKYRAGGLVVEAAKRVASGRSYVLSSTLKIQEGNEEEVSSLCKSILQWAVEKQVWWTISPAVFQLAAESLQMHTVPLLLDTFKHWCGTCVAHVCVVVLYEQNWAKTYELVESLKTLTLSCWMVKTFWWRTFRSKLSVASTLLLWPLQNLDFKGVEQCI
jgi:hypothetical protein